MFDRSTIPAGSSPFSPFMTMPTVSAINGGKPFNTPDKGEGMQGSRCRAALTMLLVMIAAPWTHLAAASATSEGTSTAGRQSEASTYVYNLFLDDPNDDIGDDVSITTLEPDDGAQHTVSILGTGKTFRTDELRSDLTVYNFLASGSPLDLFMRFTAPREDNAQERSTATVTVRLEAGSNASRRRP